MTNDNTESWFDPEATTFGDRVAGARDHANMTQADLAKRLGVKLKTLRAWEDDQSEPRANKLQMLAGLLNVSIKWLLTGEGDGLEAPAKEVELASDASAVLAEMRQLRTELTRLNDRLGHLEKRVRLLLQETIQ